MPKPIPEASPTLNRLRAAAGLIPIIESGLSDGKLLLERAALMAAFCEWVVEADPSDPEEIRLADEVRTGLHRLKAKSEFAEQK